MTFGVMTATLRNYYPTYGFDYTFEYNDFYIYQKIMFNLFIATYGVYIFAILIHSLANISLIDKIDPLISFFFGMMFGVGLILSGMCRRTKIINFLTLNENWDPSLIFVMASAVSINLVAFNLILKRKSPLLCTDFSVPTRKDINYGIIIGPALFGIGWGLTGFCPGPALANMALLPQAGIVVVFTAIGQVAMRSLLNSWNAGSLKLHNH